MEEVASEFTNILAQNKSRIHVWRYEGGELKETSEYGTFFTQSIYLVLDIRFNFEAKPRNNIYLWCGGYSNPDDEGPVNERLQVLYNLLRCSASIHHEYEGNECQAFLEAFVPYGGVRYRVPGIEFVTNRGFSTLYMLEMDKAPHWREIPASVSSLQPQMVCFLRTRNSFYLWYGFESDYQHRLRGAEMCGAFRMAVGREDPTHIVYQGADDHEFLRSLSPSAIESPQKVELDLNLNSNKEIYQVMSKGNELDFTLVAFKNEATLSVCSNENAYILKDSGKIYVWFGKSQKPEGMAIGLVVAVVFMQKMNISRCNHVQIVRSGDAFSNEWI